MDSTGLSRREFVRSTGLAAAAVGFGGAIDLVSDPARATSSNTSALSDYERYDGTGLAELVKAREVSAGELLEAAVARVEQHNPTINAVGNRHLDEVTETELKRQVPPHAQHDDLLVKMPPFEEILCRGRFRHPGRYRCAPVFSSLHQNPSEEDQDNKPANVVKVFSYACKIAYPEEEAHVEHQLTLKHRHRNLLTETLLKGREKYLARDRHGTPGPS